MPRPLRIEFPGALYHVFSRGNDKRDIFRTDEDRELFLAALGEACERFGVRIHSYCLMTNHYHLLLETPEANLSQFMKLFLGVYTIRFNRTHKRVGHLFQGRYRAHLVDKDDYFLQVSRYIHLNPVSAGMKDLPEAYPWSSLKYFTNGQKAPNFLQKDLILGQFKSSKEYIDFIREGIGKEAPLAIRKPLGGVFIASKGYVDSFRKKLVSDRRDFRRKECLEIPLDLLLELLEFERPDIHPYVLWKLGRRNQTEIARLVSKTQSAVSHSVKRTQGRLVKDPSLKRQITGIEAALSCFMD